MAHKKYNKYRAALPMTKSRKEINADYRAKKKKFRARRETRSTVSKLSMKPAAVRKRNSRHLWDNPYTATLARDGFQVHQNVWTDSRAKSVNKCLRKVCDKFKGTGEYKLRLDPNKLAIPIKLFSSSVKNAAIEFTKSIGLSSTAIVEKNIVCIVTYCGAKKQAHHVDSFKRNAMSVLHIMSRRTIWVEGVEYKLRTGDVVVIGSGVCHAGSAHPHTTPSLMLHVPIGYDEVHTYACN